MQTATNQISSGITLRVMIIGLIVLFFNFRWMIEVEAMRESPRAYFNLHRTFRQRCFHPVFFLTFELA
jgi:hypothetical protein